MTDAAFERFFETYVQPQLNALTRPTALRAAAHGDLSAFVPPDCYAIPEPAKDPELVARLVACAEERAAVDALLAQQQPRLRTAVQPQDLSMYAPPDPYAVDLTKERR